MDALGTDILAQCLTLLPLDEVVEAKQVSSVVRAGARRELTRGRWRPLWFLNEYGFDAIRGNRARRSPASIEKSMPESPDALPEAMLSLFRAAWLLEPSEVLLQLNSWPFLHKNLPMMLAPARFLRFVEPTIDGLGRAIQSLERYYRIVKAHNPCPDRSLTAYEFPLMLISHWSRKVLPNGSIDLFTTDVLTREFEHWRRPSFGYTDATDYDSAADFFIRATSAFFLQVGYSYDYMGAMYVSRWVNRAAAAAFSDILHREQEKMIRGYGRIWVNSDDEDESGSDSSSDSDSD